jgi:hypothetical protein
MCNAWNHSPGCNCGWGGDGHAGSGGGGQWSTIGYSSGASAYSHRFYDVCHPTICPECQSEVYFIRHNGGSVWVDELGWPWPKHDCFNHPGSPESYNYVTSLANLPHASPDQNLGLIYRISRPQSPIGPRLQIGCLDGSLLAALGRPGLPYEQLLGELVIVSRESAQLRHSRLGNFPINILPDTEIEDGPSLVWHRGTELMTKCALCGGYYYEDEKADHLRRCPKKLRPVPKPNIGKQNSIVFTETPTAWSKCPKCLCSVAADHLNEHLKSCRGPTQKLPT